MTTTVEVGGVWGTIETLLPIRSISRSDPVIPYVDKKGKVPQDQKQVCLGRQSSLRWTTNSASHCLTTYQPFPRVKCPLLGQASTNIPKAGSQLTCPATGRP